MTPATEKPRTDAREQQIRYLARERALKATCEEQIRAEQKIAAGLRTELRRVRAEFRTAEAKGYSKGFADGSAAIITDLLGRDTEVDFYLNSLLLKRRDPIPAGLVEKATNYWATFSELSKTPPRLRQNG